MKEEVERLVRLFIGLFAYALGIVLTMQAHIGTARGMSFMPDCQPCSP